MKTKLYYILVLLSALISLNAKAVPQVTLTSASIAAANINQGAVSNIVYAVKMKVTTTAVTINNIQFVLSGNHDNNDLTNVYVYYNDSVSLTGASYLGG